MEIDMKKLDTAILYMKRIADGNNPVNNMPAEDDAVLNNPNVIRCMFYVKEILEEVKKNDGIIAGTRKNRKEDGRMAFPVEALERFSYEEDKTISKLAEQVNKDVDKEKYKTISYGTIIKWLKDEGYLESVPVADKHTANRPTEKGRVFGIYTEEKTNSQGQNYIAVIYNRNAQIMIVNHLIEIVS